MKDPLAWPASRRCAVGFRSGATTTRGDGDRVLARFDGASTGGGQSNDEICTPAHTHGLYEAVGSADKELYEIPDANHYYLGEGQDVPLAKAVEITDDWLKRHGFAGREPYRCRRPRN